MPSLGIGASIWMKSPNYLPRLICHRVVIAYDNAIWIGVFARHSRKNRHCLGRVSRFATSISDDVLVCVARMKRKKLYHALKRSQKSGVKYNGNECPIKKLRVAFFWYYMTDTGFEMDPGKVLAICNVPTPSSVSELQSILGRINYLSRFTKNFATKTAHHRDFTKHDIQFQWLPEHQKAFDKMKEDISSPDVLAYFDGSKHMTVQTDASRRGVGATLMQDGKPVAYASKSLTTTE